MKSICPQVTCSEYAVVPMILGQTLQSVSMHVDGQITSYVLHLVFGSGYVCNGRVLDVGTTHVFLKSVLKLRVREWWHPLYPQPVSRFYYDNDEDDCSWKMCIYRIVIFLYLPVPLMESVKGFQNKWWLYVYINKDEI